MNTGPCTFPCLNGGQCVYPDSCNCSLYQATGTHCQTVPNSGLEREMTCRSWGQYNYETFDGLYYYFPGKCSYTLLKDCEENIQPSLLIQVHNDPECTSFPYSCTRSVSLFLPWEGEIRLQDLNVTFKGQSVKLPHNIHDLELEQIADYVLVSQPQVFTLAWHGLNGSIYIKMSPEFVGRTCGLCGNFNADVNDDLKTSYGKLNFCVFTEDLAMFGNSWVEEEPQKATCSMIPYLYPSPCSGQDSHVLLKVEEVCATLLKEPFKSCHEFVSPYSYMASCSNDLCLSGPNGDVVCQVFTEYARACAHADHPLNKWRTHVPVCGVECPAELQYRECIPCCPVHCRTEQMCIDSKLQCLDGCYCQDDLIYEDGLCVKASDCPCEHRGMLYPSGHTIQEECNNCTCSGGAWNCTEQKCPGECSVTGDMYFQSFDGRVYTFLATCQYVLAKSRNSGGFTVTIQNAPCGPNLDGACIQSVNVVLNEDPRTEVTLSHSGEVFMASQFRISLPYSDDVFQIQELSSLFVQVKTSQGLLLQYNWREFRLYLQLGELWRDDTVGLCGTFNGNIQDDFLAPSGMIESTPQLFGNAWRVSSACVPRPSLPQLDPCDTHQQAASYAVEKCEVLMQEVFAVCHEHVSPVGFQLQCRADVCKCGTPCLCSALAHYARTCRKHNVIIEFRSHVPECSVACPATMEYGLCVSSCQRRCLSFSMPQSCGDECEEGCVCPQGTYYSTHTHSCVKRNECPCSFLGTDYSPGDVIMTSSGVHMFFLSDKLCPPGQIYEDCGNMVDGPSVSKGLACDRTCESYLLNLTCSTHEPCVPGCVCPTGLLKHGDECFEPVACPCLWKGKEYYPGDKVSSTCHLCVCQQGTFQCEFRPCPSMCTAYGDRHYRTFDGLLFDYVGACKVYLLKSSADVMVSVTTENIDCFESGVICRKALLISVGRSFIVFDDETGKPSPSSVIDRQNVLIWSAGYFTIVHLSQYELSVLWDRKTTIHIQAGPRWQGKLSGLCGNFDLKTVNEMRTPDNMDSATPQEFGNSWTAAECVNSPDIRHPCSLNPLREAFAKKQCGILLSEVLCTCFCSSVAAYAHRCCHQGVTVDWRSPSLCRESLCYKIICKAQLGLTGTDGIVTMFMMTPGLSKNRPHDSSLVSLEALDRPNFFLHAERSGQLKLRKWEESRAFWDAATFILHRNTWISGFDSLESLMWPGFFLHYMLSRLQLLKYIHSDRYRRATLFKLISKSTTTVGPQCQWRYESCVNPCFRTCSDPSARSCVSILKVEGCLPECPAHMVLDEVTQRCVYLEDCKLILHITLLLIHLAIIQSEFTLPSLHTLWIILDYINYHPPVILPDLIPTPTDTIFSTSLATSMPSSIATTTTTITHTSATLSLPSTTLVSEKTATTLKTSASSSKPLSYTPKTTRMPSTASLTPLITVRTRTASASVLPPMTTTLKPAVSSSPSISTRSTVASSADLPYPSSTEQPSRVSAPPEVSPLSVSTSRITTEYTSPTFRVSPLSTTRTEPATVSQLSTITTRTTKPTGLSTDSLEPFSAETPPVTKAPALELSTSATTAQPTVSAPLHNLTVTLPTFAPAHSTEFTTAVSALSTLKTTPMRGTESTEPSLAHTTEKTMPTSFASAKTSTTYLPAKPSETTLPAEPASSVPETSTSEQPVTSKVSLMDVSTELAQPLTTITEVSSFGIPVEEKVETAATTTYQPMSTLSTFYTTAQPEDRPQTTTKAEVPPLTTLTTVVLSPTASTTSTLTPLDVSTTYSATSKTSKTPPATVTTATVSTVTSESSTESSLSQFSESSSSSTTSTSAHFIETLSTSILSTVETETKTETTVIDECTKLICVNGQLLLFNKSQSCPYDPSPPNCGLLGFAVLVNGDKCCPKWDCPCRCSVFPDLNVVTFDGNNVAIFKAASYVVTQLPNETVSILVQECNSSDNTLVWNFTNLCLAALNITHESNQVLINRLQRRVSICLDTLILPRFKKYGFEILDTGNMYLIRSPAGLKIQWFHSTGMMVIETETYTHKLSTMGLCGCCDGNPLNDLTLSNGSIMAESEDPAVFIDSWQVPNTTSYISHSRRREVNCSTSDCSACLNMLNNLTFTACHPFVPPATFCEVWVRDAEYVNNPCVALAAYVASCHKFNICIEWRSPDYCPFICPESLRYQACLPACTAPSCPNQEFEYDAGQCSGLAEGCVCPQGTLLHRPYSALCIPPNKCACTDSFGAPRALGEVWKASVDGCCMYRCESDGIVPVEFNCSDVPQPVCTRAGEISISVADDNSCCPQRLCVCNQTMCEPAPLACQFGEKMVSYFRTDSCCPEYACECDPDQCVLDVPVCREDQTLIATRAEGSCCLAHICICDVCSEAIPECEDGELLIVDTNSTERCCPVYHCLCEPSRCPVITCPFGMAVISTVNPGQCCPSLICECACEKVIQPKCVLVSQFMPNLFFYECLNTVRDPVCVDGERGVMKPGQTLMEHTARGLCYTTRCTNVLDSATGFYRIQATSTNCTAQCQPNQVYVPPKDPSACCGVCKNVSCIHHNENGTLVLYKPGKSWVSDCVRYDCSDTQSGPVLISYSYSCPPFNETECMKIGGTIVTYMDGCCKTCKEDGKSCQKVTVRMTIRKNDCRSNRPVNIVSCDGKCPSASIYNYNINTYARFCKCCREMGLQRRSVQLYCSGNSTWVNYSIQEPTDCSCQWS
uniref:Otogelin n=1 Tax=Astyanax mexicanus TaxID=7994 RepID=A0A8B9HR24_ASTMX